MSIRLCICSFACLLSTTMVASADWTSFRNGGSSVSGALPVSWSPESVAWQMELTGYGQSTPVIYDGHVFVASVVGGMKEQCLLQCISVEDGREEWRFEVPSSKQSASNYMASRAAPTPVVDANGVYVFFETGDLVAVDLAGNKLWHRDLSKEFGDFENNHGLGSSPAQNTTHIFLNLEHKGPSCCVAIRKTSGATDWKAERPSGSSWSSPIVVDDEGLSQVVISSAGAVTAYSAKDGRQLWTVAGLDGNSVPSPTIDGSRLFIGARLPEFAEEGSIRSNCCLDLSKLNGGSPEVVWRATKAISDYASPVVVGDFVFFINKVGVLHCLDASTGKLHYRERLRSPNWATPIATEDHLYLFGKDGSTQIVKAGPKYELVAANHLWDPEAPPKPEKYVEFTGGRGHGHGAPGADSNGQAGKAGNSSESGRPSGRPGGGMIAALMRGDKNGDGNLDADEVPADFRSILPRVDKNKDGKLDAAELEAMAKSFAERRAGSRTGARDPIVYGAAASDGNLVIRTGTRLYCVRN